MKKTGLNDLQAFIVYSKIHKSFNIYYNTEEIRLNTNQTHLFQAFDTHLANLNNQLQSNKTLTTRIFQGLGRHTLTLLNHYSLYRKKMGLTFISPNSSLKLLFLVSYSV